MSAQVIVFPRALDAIVRRFSDDVAAGTAWYNALTPSERRQWHEVAGSAHPLDCWRAFQAGAALP